MESRLIVVDGYNLILRSDQLRPSKNRTLRESRDKLLNMLAWVVGGGDVRFLVVFDGADAPAENPPRQGRVDVRYSRPPDKADDVIRAVVEDQIERVDRVTVVTSDLEVARHARAMGADIALADMFLSSVLNRDRDDTAEKPGAPSKKEVERWAEMFRNRSESEPDETTS